MKPSKQLNCGKPTKLVSLPYKQEIDYGYNLIDTGGKRKYGTSQSDITTTE